MGWGFGHLWEELCSFTTERSITFVDIRLGVTYKLMCAAILYWIATTLLVTELYLANAFPVSVFNLWASTTYEGPLGKYDYKLAQDEVWRTRSSLGSGETNETEGTYCDNSAYDSTIMSSGEALNFTNVKCAFLDKAEAVELEETHLMVVTAQLNQYVSFHRKASDDDECTVDSFKTQGLAEQCPSSANPTFSTQYGNCYCSYDESHFVAGAEYLSLVLSHEFKSRYESGAAEVTHVRIKENEDEILASFEAEEEIQLPMPKVLEWLGVDLDELEEGKPSDRLKGVHIGVTLNYYNWHQAPGLEKKFTLEAGEVVCILELELLEDSTEEESVEAAKELPAGGKVSKKEEAEEEEEEKHGGALGGRLNAARGGGGGGRGVEEGKGRRMKGRVNDTGATSGRRRRSIYNNKGVKLGESEEHLSKSQPKRDKTELQYFVQTAGAVGTGAYVIRHKDGVRVSVSYGGVISELDAALLFETFIQAFLLLNLANIICKFVAYNMLGIKSKIFFNFGEYKVNYEHEYARFGVQSIVAAQSFKELDTDNSGNISERELVQALFDAQGDNTKFTMEDNEALAAFIIACGDKDGAEGQNPDGEISVTEWYDLFASGYADSTSIRDTMRALGRKKIAQLRKKMTLDKHSFITPSLRRGLVITGLGGSSYGATSPQGPSREASEKAPPTIKEDEEGEFSDEFSEDEDALGDDDKV